MSSWLSVVLFVEGALTLLAPYASFGASVATILAAGAALWTLTAWRTEVVLKERSGVARMALVASLDLLDEMQAYRDVGSRLLVFSQLDPRRPDAEMTDFEVTYHEESRRQEILSARIGEVRAARIQCHAVFGAECAATLQKLERLGLDLRLASGQYVRLMRARHRGHELPEDALRANGLVRAAPFPGDVREDDFGNQMEAVRRAIDATLRPLTLSKGR